MKKGTRFLIKCFKRRPSNNLNCSLGSKVSPSIYFSYVLTGVGCLALFQGIFPTGGLNPGPPHYGQILYHLSYLRSYPRSNNLFLVLVCPWHCLLHPYYKTPCGDLALILPCSCWSYPSLTNSALSDIPIGSLKHLQHRNLANATNPSLFPPWKLVVKHLSAYHWELLFNKCEYNSFHPNSLIRIKVESHKKIGRNCKCSLLSKRNQIEKATTYCMLPIIWHSGKGKTMETVKRSVVIVGGGCIGGQRRFIGQWKCSAS